MVRAGDLIGLPVLGGEQLKRLGTVQEVLFSQDGRWVTGLRLDGGWLQPGRMLDYQAVRAVGEAHILADELYLPAHEQSRPRRELLGLPVLRGSGEEAGIMDDVHFDPKTGEVKALQLSHGLVDDLLMGKAVMPVEAPVLTGEAAILINPDVGADDAGLGDSLGGTMR